MSGTTAAAERGPRRWLRIGVLTIAGLFYAYAVWNAIFYLVSYVTGFGLNAYGWFILLFAAAFPLIVFAAVIAIGRRRAIWQHALVAVTGLGLVAVFWMDVVSYIANNIASLVG